MKLSDRPGPYLTLLPSLSLGKWNGSEDTRENGGSSSLVTLTRRSMIQTGKVNMKSPVFFIVEVSRYPIYLSVNRSGLSSAVDGGWPPVPRWNSEVHDYFSLTHGLLGVFRPTGGKGSRTKGSFTGIQINPFLCLPMYHNVTQRNILRPERKSVTQISDSQPGSSFWLVV